MFPPNQNICYMSVIILVEANNNSIRVWSCSRTKQKTHYFISLPTHIYITYVRNLPTYPQNCLRTHIFVLLLGIYKSIQISRQSIWQVLIALLQIIIYFYFFLQNCDQNMPYWLSIDLYRDILVSSTWIRFFSRNDGKYCAQNYSLGHLYPARKKNKEKRNCKRVATRFTPEFDQKTCIFNRQLNTLCRIQGN